MVMTFLHCMGMEQLGPIYTKHQPQYIVNAAIMLATCMAHIEQNEFVQNGLQPQSGATVFGSIDFNESCVASVITGLTPH